MASWRSKHFFAGHQTGELATNRVGNPRVRARLFQERYQFEDHIDVEGEVGLSFYRAGNGRIMVIAKRIRRANEIGDGFVPNRFLLWGQLYFNLPPNWKRCVNWITAD